MLKNLRKMKAQSTVEYAVLIIVIIGALLAIQVYIKRGIQGRFKSSADDIGDQFSPGNTNSVKSVVTSSKSAETFGFDAAGAAAQGVTRSELLAQEKTDTSEQAHIINTDQEYWGTSP